MATHLKIKTHENNHIHFDIFFNNYTLCGLESRGDETMGIAKGKVVKAKVNCPECIRIVKFCHKIKESEFIK